MKTTYDPALRKTPIGRSLYYYWKMVRKNPHTNEWDLFPNFYDWSLNNGYTPGFRLYQVDAEQPYSPENCVWKDREETIDMARAAEWNAVVNRLRKQWGLEPLEGTEYGDI